MSFAPARADYRLFVFGGVAVVAYANSLMLGYSPAMDWRLVVTATLLQGAGLGTLLPALAKTAFGTLDRKFRPEGTVFFNRSRVYGSAIGIAVVQIFFYNNTQAMHLALAKNLAPFRAAAQVAGSIDKADLAALNEMITRQAAAVAGSIGLSDITLEKLRGIVSAARIKPSVVQVESHPYLPEWEMLDFCREHGIVLQAFAAVGHAMEPKVIDEPVITAIAQRVHKTPAQVVLAWAVQRGTAFLTTSTKPQRIQENFEISALPEDAMREIRERITTNVRFNAVVETGVPGFIPRVR
jgi:hypothetical protein